MSTRDPLPSHVSTAFFGKTYPILLVVFLVVISAAGAAIGVGMGGNGTSHVSGVGDYHPGPDRNQCQIETRTDTTVVADAAERIGGGDAWSLTLELAPGDRLLLDIRNVAGVRPAASIVDPAGETILETESIPHVDEEIEASQSGRYTLTLSNLHSSQSGLWDIYVAHEETWEEEVCA